MKIDKTWITIIAIFIIIGGTTGISLLTTNKVEDELCDMLTGTQAESEQARQNLEDNLTNLIINEQKERQGADSMDRDYTDMTKNELSETMAIGLNAETDARQEADISLQTSLDQTLNKLNDLQSTTEDLQSTTEQLDTKITGTDTKIAQTEKLIEDSWTTIRDIENTLGTHEENLHEYGENLTTIQQALGLPDDLGGISMMRMIETLENEKDDLISELGNLHEYIGDLETEGREAVTKANLRFDTIYLDFLTLRADFQAARMAFDVNETFNIVFDCINSLEQRIDDLNTRVSTLENDLLLYCMGGVFEGHAVVCDMDGDLEEETITLSESGILHCFDHHGELMWTWRSEHAWVFGSEQARTDIPIQVGDFDQDGLFEILAVWGAEGQYEPNHARPHTIRMIQCNATGHPVYTDAWGWEFAVEPGHWVIRKPTYAKDIAGQQAVVVSSGGNIWVLNARNGQLLWSSALN